MTLNEYLGMSCADGTMAEKACAVAEQAHFGQKRWNGDPYVTHPIRVAESFFREGLLMAEVEDERVVAYLHDVVEDTDVTLDQLREFGFTETQVVAVDSVTKCEGESYLDFVLRAKKNPIGCRVKVADIRDNMSDLPDPPPRRQLRKHHQRAEKYRLALWILEHGSETFGQCSCFEAELETYAQNLDTLLSLDNVGRYALIHGKDVVGVFDTYRDAVQTGYEKCGLEQRFFVKQITTTEPCNGLRKEVSSGPGL